MMKNNRTVQKTYSAARPIRQLLPYIDGVSAAQRRQVWTGSPWNAFRM